MTTRQRAKQQRDRNDTTFSRKKRKEAPHLVPQHVQLEVAGFTLSAVCHERFQQLQGRFNLRGNGVKEAGLGCLERRKPTFSFGAFNVTPLLYVLFVSSHCITYRSLVLSR
jgi:hypothetical protein